MFAQLKCTMKKFSFYWLISILYCICADAYERRIRVKDNKIIIQPRYPGRGSNLVFIDISSFSDTLPAKCSERERFCLQWTNQTRLEIRIIDDHCEHIHFQTDTHHSLTTEFNLTGLQIYGGPETSYQKWPAQKSILNNTAYVSSQEDSRAILESYWLDSKGQYIYVNKNVPLFVHQTRDILKITATRQAPYIRLGNLTILDYLQCTFKNSKDAQMDAINRVLGKPRVLPDYKMVRYPIWSSWAQFKENISQTVLSQFALSIQRYEYHRVQFEIDEKWETCYGSCTIDADKFPNMTDLVISLKKLDFRVTLWVHPFINVDCEPFFTFANNSGFLVKNDSGNVVTSWWNGKAGYVDFTNPEAVDWWTGRLHKLLQTTQIDSFKFDAGESSWSPELPIFRTMTDDHPETILKSYIQTVSQFGGLIEVRSARGTQEIGSFVRMMDRETSWNSKNGLSTLIPTLLLMNILGYPFVLPDMIGGNGYNNDVLTEEMYLRWLQINVFMPALQFSYPPWQFSQKTIQITKHYIDLHAEYADMIYSLMTNAKETGTPVNLPLWWLDPNDEVAQSIDSEFLLGENLLVAPVLENGARSRDIYFPKGSWLDENDENRQVITGPKWVYSYAVGLDTLPYFTRVSTSATICLNSSWLAIIFGLKVASKAPLFFMS